MEGVWLLLSNPDPDAAAQGCELLQSLDDPVLLQSLSDGCAINGQGLLRINAAVREHVHPDHHERVVLTLLRATGRLKHVRVFSPHSRCQRALPVLRGFDGLKTLHLHAWSSLSDLSAIRSLPSLQELNLWSASSLTDLSPLTTLPALRSLYVSRCSRLEDLSPLKGMGLVYFGADACQRLCDLTPLTALPNLKTVSIRRCGCTDLAPLQEMPGVSIHSF
ncbi:MAG: leucine-rich repeat domain-containing protein [Myxococcota bacterium]